MTTSLKFGLKPQTIQVLKGVFANYPKIEKILIYGSRAKGNFKNGSDIDLSLIAPNLNITDLLKIENEVEELMLPYKVDLSLLHLIENPEVVDHIKRIGIDF